MKNLKTYLIVVFLIFFWLLWISNADVLIPEKRVSAWSQVTIKSNCVKFIDFENIAWLKVVLMEKYYEKHPPFWVVYSFKEMPQNQCTRISRWENANVNFYLTKSVKPSWTYEFEEELSHSQFKSLIKKKLGNATLVDINDIIRTEKCDHDHITGWCSFIATPSKPCYAGWFEWYWCDPTRRESTEIIYTLKNDWKWWYKLIRMIWNNWEEEIIKNIGNMDRFLFFKSRLLTIVLETIMLFAICKLFFKQDNIKNWRIILTWILASSITLPILRFVLPHLFHDWTVFAISGEIFVTIVEVVIIKYLLNIKRRKAIISSITCNLFSVLIWLFL